MRRSLLVALLALPLLALMGPTSTQPSRPNFQALTVLTRQVSYTQTVNLAAGESRTNVAATSASTQLPAITFEVPGTYQLIFEGAFFPSAAPGGVRVNFLFSGSTGNSGNLLCQMYGTSLAGGSTSEGTIVTSTINIDTYSCPFPAWTQSGSPNYTTLRTSVLVRVTSAPQTVGSDEPELADLPA